MAKRTARLSIAVRVDELQDLEAYADEIRIPVSTWARSMLLQHLADVRRGIARSIYAPTVLEESIGGELDG
jgi:hypothetical protein